MRVDKDKLCATVNKAELQRINRARQKCVDDVFYYTGITVDSSELVYIGHDTFTFDYAGLSFEICHDWWCILVKNIPKKHWWSRKNRWIKSLKKFKKAINC